MEIEKVETDSDKDKPVDLIIEQLKSWLNTGQLKPGDRLLSERKLAEQFGASRSHVREAIKKLEFYGILKTLPQSGTFVAALDISALEGLISDALHIETYDFYSLAETRLLLEVSAIRLCCERRTEEDLKLIEMRLRLCDAKIRAGEPAVEEDLNFHRQIATASKNQVLKSMMLIITPDLMTNYRKFWICDNSRRQNSSITALEHELMFEYIRKQDADAAEIIMRQHLAGVMEFASRQKVE